MSEQGRVLIIGIDAATLDLVEPWVAEGRLPNLERLMRGGSYGKLISTLQPATAPAWASFITGLNQGRHGLFDFVRRRPGTYQVEVTNASHVGAPTIFELLSLAGKKVISVNVPYTSPPRPVNGIMVGGPFTPVMASSMVYPSTYYETLREVVPDYFIFPEYRPLAADPLDDLVGQLLREIEQREQLGKHLMRTQAWDLFMVVFMATDEAHHTFWSAMTGENESLARYKHVIRDIYARVDEAVGALVAAAQADSQQALSVVVVSDHGAGHFRAMVNLNHWLAGQGYFAFRRDAARRLLRWSSDLLRRSADGYRRYVPARLRKAIRTSLGARRFDQAKGGFESALVTSAVDWGRTRAYALGVGGNIYINLAGREPQGQVSPGTAYEQLCREISGRLLELTDPETGQQVVRQVHRREGLYTGEYADQAPDLVVEWHDYAYWGRASFDHWNRPIFQAQRYFEYGGQPLSGSHRPNGLVIGYGPQVRPGTRIEKAHLWDVTATVLDWMKVRPAAPLDGQALQAWQNSPSLSEAGELVAPDTTASRQAQSYSSEEAALIAERLRALGYL